MKKFGNFQGFGLGTLIYAGVHVFSFNFMLIMAAGVAGAFWGGLYLWKRDLELVIVSHSLWSAFIFAVFPIH
jgi:membrane protease YdiL (CAAX protease family)